MAAAAAALVPAPVAEVEETGAPAPAPGAGEPRREQPSEAVPPPPPPVEDRGPGVALSSRRFLRLLPDAADESAAVYARESRSERQVSVSLSLWSERQIACARQFIADSPSLAVADGSGFMRVSRTVTCSDVSSARLIICQCCDMWR